MSTSGRIGIGLGVTHKAKVFFVAAASALMLASDGDSSVAVSAPSEQTADEAQVVEPSELDEGEGAEIEPESAPKNVVLIGDSNIWYWDRPFAPHRMMEHMLADLPWLDKTWQGAKVHNLAISGTRPYDWIVEKKCVEGKKSHRHPIKNYCDEIEFLAEGITRVVPEPDVVIVSLGLNSIRWATPKEAVDRLAALKAYLAKISPKVIMTAPFPMPRGPHRDFVAGIRQEMFDRGLLDWDWPLLQFEANDTKVHLTERSRAVTGSLMAIWLVYGSPPLRADAPAYTGPTGIPAKAAAKPAAPKKQKGKKAKKAEAQPVPASGAAARRLRRGRLNPNRRITD
ncbi:MAG: hypothetical protein P8R42_08825 [Candidatus Binatia bacterium]|nr:hypothetical protein [Candidatus Binatia bacterium]